MSRASLLLPLLTTTGGVEVSTTGQGPTSVIDEANASTSLAGGGVGGSTLSPLLSESSVVVTTTTSVIEDTASTSLATGGIGESGLRTSVPSSAKDDSSSSSNGGTDSTSTTGGDASTTGASGGGMSSGPSNSLTSKNRGFKDPSAPVDPAKKLCNVNVYDDIGYGPTTRSDSRRRDRFEPLPFPNTDMLDVSSSSSSEPAL